MIRFLNWIKFTWYPSQHGSELSIGNLSEFIGDISISDGIVVVSNSISDEYPVVAVVYRL